MKLKKKSIILSIINYINFLFFSFQFLFKYINCDCSYTNCPEGVCSPDCRVSIYGNKKYLCSGITSSDHKYYYIRSKYEDYDGKCHLIDECPDKVVAKTKECVPECRSLIEVGDFCFDENELDGFPDDYEPIIDTNYKKKYKCKEYTNIKLIDGREYHICIETPGDNIPSKKCPSLYYDSDEKKCVDSCNKKIVPKTIEQDENTFTYYECRNECKFIENGEKEFEYDESLDETGSTKIYCLPQCPLKTPYYYKISSQSPKCQKGCNYKHFYNNNNECFSECKSDDRKLYYLKDNSKEFFFCDLIPESISTELCPYTSHPYKYKNKNLCLQSCYDTQLNFILNKKTYSFINDNNKKYCVDDCFIEDQSYYSDDDSLSCVKDCSKTKNKYHYNHKCVNSCQEEGFRYYIKTSLDGSSPSEEDSGSDITYEELECVNDCPDKYYIYSNMCVKICPKSSDKPYLNIETKECTSCNIPENPSNPEEGEGFIKNGDTSDNIICYKKCSSDTYYKRNDNICYPLSYASNDKNCYFAEDNPNICYLSCKEIPGPDKYNYESNNICYKDNICGNNYYYIIEGYTKCIEDDGNINKVIRECEKHNFIYLRGKECINDCEKNEYKIMPVETIYKGIEILGQCCSNPNCDDNYKYYSESDKILNKTCSLKEIEETYDKIGDTGNCVSECPSDLYESENGKKCLVSCPNSFYVVGNTKKCINNCKSINRYNFEDNRECITNCSLVEKNIRNYYYYDDSNTCYKLCKNNNKNDFKFSKKVDNKSPQKCLSSCPENYKYYNEKDYLCLQSCSFYKNSTSNICVDQCASTEYILSNNTCIKEECPSEEPFSVEIDKKCVKNCTKYDSKYEYFHYKTRKCLEQCPPDAPYKYGKQCINQCPEGFYAESNECKLKCEDTSYYIKDEDNENAYKCVQNCDLSNYYVSSSTGECVKKCGMWENFVGNNKRCKNSCESKDGLFYKEIDKITGEKGYTIYQCLQNYGGESEYLIHGTYEIVEECPENIYYLSENGNICYSKCIYDKTLPFSIEEENEGGTKIKKCSYECIGENLNYGEDKICLSNCDSFQITKIINDENKQCIDKCNLKSLYKFETKDPDDNNHLHCSTKCKGTEQKYSEADYKCLDKCIVPYNYEDGNICRDKCPDNTFIQKKEENLYECKEKCDENLYYYKKDRKCIAIEQCDYIIQDTNECISNCSLIEGNKKYYFYDFYGTDDEIITGTSRTYTHHTCVLKCPPDKPFLKENNHCAKECNQESYPYYIEEEKICKINCDKNMVIDENICRYECPKEKFLNPITRKCINDCSETNYKYYYPPNNTCIEKCDKNLYIDGNKCVESCPIEETDENGKKKLYADFNNKCVKECPSNDNYIIDKFTHNEKDTQKKCLSSCPSEYPYYIPFEDENTNSLNKCVGTCLYYVISENKNEKSTTKHCYAIEIENENENKCPDSHKYFIRYENGTNQCLKECPNDMHYYDPENYRCYKKCPDSKPYYKFNSDLCFDECDTKNIDYETKECVLECSSKQFWARDGNIKYCLNKCNSKLGEYLSNDKECVKSCDEEKYLVQNIIDPLNKACKCRNLYSIESSGSTKCFDENVIDCGLKNSPSEPYKYRKFGTNECKDFCFGYLSPSEDICYENNIKCEDIDINTELVISGNLLKCDCKYKYYIYKDPDTNKNYKICLGEYEDCPTEYQFYTPATKECVESCSGENPKILENICLSKCPDNSDINNQVCTCKSNYYFYKKGETNYECKKKEECKYIIEDKHECVDKCKDSGYEILYEGKCYLSCNSFDGMDVIEIEDDSYLKEFATYTCQCKSNWYFDDSSNENKCIGEKKCSEIEVGEKEPKYKYLIKDTKKCVINCPNSYFSFNNECFKSCEDAKNTYHYPVKKDKNLDSNECICENLWKAGDSDDEKICLKDFICEELMINETKQCVKSCPPDYPLLFNNQCYKKGSCPEETKEDIINGDKCICKNLWHKQNNNKQYCIIGDECPDYYPYKNAITKECDFKPCPKKIFNSTCYDNCPDGTIPKKNSDGTTDESNECECDPEFGYWHIIDKEKKRMICGLKECPAGKKYYKNDTKECLSSCIKNKLYEYDYKCYEKECPYPTVSENIILNKYECTVKKYTTATNLDESYKFLKAELIGLYNSIPKGGIIYNNFSSTMQVYGIKKNENDTKDLILRSSLSYIDISSCADKVF